MNTGADNEIVIDVVAKTEAALTALRGFKEKAGGLFLGGQETPQESLGVHVEGAIAGLETVLEKVRVLDAEIATPVAIKVDPSQAVAAAEEVGASFEAAVDRLAQASEALQELATARPLQAISTEAETARQALEEVATGLALVGDAEIRLAAENPLGPLQEQAIGLELAFGNVAAELVLTEESLAALADGNPLAPLTEQAMAAEEALGGAETAAEALAEKLAVVADVAVPALNTLGPAAESAKAAVLDFLQRTNEASPKFGIGLEQSSERAIQAISLLETEIGKAAEISPVSERQLQQLADLRRNYEETAAWANKFMAAQVQLSAAGGSVRPLEAEIAAVEERLKSATTRMVSLTASVEVGGRGATRQIASLRIAFQDLERQIAELQASGADVSGLQERLAGLQRQLQVNTEAAGRFAAEMKVVADQERAAAIQSGRLEGQFHSLQDIARLISPELGGMVGNLLGIAAAAAFLGPIMSAVKESISKVGQGAGYSKDEVEQLTTRVEALYNPLQALRNTAKDAGDALERSRKPLGVIAEAYDNLTNGIQGTIQEQRNLARILNAAGVDTTNKSLKELTDTYNRLAASGQLTAEMAEKVTATIVGDERAQKAYALAIAGSASEALRLGQITTDSGQAYIALIDKEIAELQKFGDSTEALEEMRRALLVAVTEALVKQGEQLKVNAVVSEDSATRFVAAVDKQISAIQDFGQRTKESEAEVHSLVGESIAILQRRADQLKKDGLATSQQADQFIADIQRQIDALARLGQTAPELEALKKQIQEMERAAQLDGISVGIRQVEEFIAEVRKGGSITHEEADKLEADIKREIKAIQELPAVERQQYAARLAELQRASKEFEKFTTEYETEQERQQKAAKQTAQREEEEYRQRTAALAAFLSKIKDLAKKAGDDGGAGDIEKQLASKRTELAGLKDKSASGLVDQADLDRMHQLDQEVRDLTLDLGKVGKGGDALHGLGASARDGAAAIHGLDQAVSAVDSSTQRAAEQLKATVLNEIESNKQFAESYNKLGAAGQAGLKQLVEGFVSEVDAQTVTKESLEAFSQQFAQFFQNAGLLSKTFQTDVGGAFSSLDASTAKASTSLDGVGKSAQTVNAGAKDAASGVTAVGDASKSTADAADTAAAGFIKMGDKLIPIKQHASDASSAVKDLGTKTDSVQQSTEKMAASLDKAATSAAAIAKDGADAATGLKAIGDGATAAEPPLTKVATASEKIAQSGLADELLSEGEALSTVSEGAGSASSALSDFDGEVANLAVSLDDLKPNLAGTGRALGEIATSGRNAKTEVHGLVLEFRELVQLTHDLKTAQDAVMGAQA